MATTINIRRVTAKDSERRFLIAAGPRLEAVLNSAAFKHRVLHHQYYGAARFANNTIGRWRLSNARIYAALMAGREALDPRLDYEWDMDLYVYSGRRKIIGYTSPGITTVYMNRRALRFTPAGLPRILGNMAHEHCHKLGFGHDRKNTRRRAYSVPYGVGAIVTELFGTW